MRTILSSIFIAIIGMVLYKILFVRSTPPQEILNNIITVAAIFGSLYSLYKNNFKLQMFIENIFLRIKKVKWSLDGLFEIKNNNSETEIRDLIKNSIEDNYSYYISNEGKNFIDIHIDDISLVSLKINNQPDSNKIDFYIFPFEDTYNSYRDVVDKFHNFISIITRDFSIINENYTLKLDFKKDKYNPYYKFLRSTFREAKLSEMSINVKLKETNDIEVLVGKHSFIFNFLTLIHARTEIEKVLKLSLKV